MDTAPQSASEALARLSPQAREAYERFLKSGSAEDLRTLVTASLADFMPNRKVLETVGELGPATRLVGDLQLDSLAVVEIVFFFEDLFQISIPSSEILGLETVSDLSSYVDRKLRERQTRT